MVTRAGVLPDLQNEKQKNTVRTHVSLQQRLNSLQLERSAARAFINSQRQLQKEIKTKEEEQNKIAMKEK